MNIKNLLLNKVKEKGVCDIIINYKKYFEYQDIINKYNNNWIEISKSKDITEDFIETFKNKIEWYEICSKRKLSEKFMRKYKNNISWFTVSEYQKLSEDFIREFQDEVDWFYVSYYQEISLDFIKEFKNKWTSVSRNVISEKKNLSVEYMIENGIL